MPQPLTASLPPDLDLDAGYTIQFAAISPTDASAVTGVNVSDASLLVTNIIGGDLTSGFEDTEPLWVPLPNESL